MLKEYVRKKDQKVGMLLALALDDEIVRIGWSKLNTKFDKFDKEIAFALAFTRALNGTMKFVPRSMENQYVNFVERASRYYKDKIVLFDDLE